MRKIYDLQALIKTVLDKDIPLEAKKKALKPYGISYINTLENGTFRFQCWNTDPRWFGKILRVNPLK